LTNAYLDALARQSLRVADAIGPLRIARMAVGGGTPTYFDARQLDRLMRISSDLFGVKPGSIPMSVETSPRTAEFDRLRVLKDFGVSRISIGVQSFVESEVEAAQRAQKNAWVERALERIRDLKFQILNLDLIYGLPGQTVASWLHSLRAALNWQPEEIYLYPLYVRPLTGLGRRGCDSYDELRLACYRSGRELLLAEGYEQISMRMFRRAGSAAGDDPVYCCQDDGMIGLGCGARSYTRRLHYSSEYAVGSSGVRDIIDAYIRRSEAQFGAADYGCDITDAEYRRRWVIKSLFRATGLDRGNFASLFGADVLDHFPQLIALAESGYFGINPQKIEPTPLGLEWSDALGPMLFSDDVKAKMDEFSLR
jgi:oxygen-independent coproporphyrinogen-3 oxidase